MVSRSRYSPGHGADYIEQIPQDYFNNSALTLYKIVNIPPINKYIRNTLLILYNHIHINSLIGNLGKFSTEDLPYKIKVKTLKNILP